MMNYRYPLLLILVVASLIGLSSGFSTISTRQNSLRTTASFSLHAVNRRQLLGGLAAAVLVPPTQPAHATYSAYTRREDDWKDRQKTGNVSYSNARDLRSQLAEIAPANSERSKIFCPNGPSAAVSPLMENKCGDRLATPSVFGRTEDVLGNSIPGFAGGFYSSGMNTADTGGMPSYGSISGTGKANTKLIGN